MTKKEMEEAILASKNKKGLTWKEISNQMGLDQVCVAAACMGSASLLQEEADKLAKILDLDSEIKQKLSEYPTKGEGQVVPSDPLIYRFFEINYVYGPVLKSIIHEMFGDGIMSAIDFSMKVEKEEDPKGDRVKITMSGKFLPYKKW